MSNFQIDKNGYYGEYGGAFVPEMLYPNITEIKEKYLSIINSDEFKNLFRSILKNYVSRPTPLYFSKKLSVIYNAKIYLKREDLAHTGSHKINNAIGQAIIAKMLGKKKIIAETGAGQHGVASATASTLMDLDCDVYMGEVDVQRQMQNVRKIQMLGANVISVKTGSKTLKDAINEAIREWINNPSFYYLIGSVVGPDPYPDMVARLQSIISQEIREQLIENENRDYPDFVIACVGGGSNAAGAFYHFVDNPNVKLIGVEAAGKGIQTNKNAATINNGTLGVIHGSKTLVMQDSFGQIIEPYSISAGLDYPAIGPFHANLFNTKRAEYVGVDDRDALKAAMLLSREEGILPALETAHAIAVLSKMKFKPDDIVVLNLSGRGDKDMEMYIKNIK